MGDFGDRQSLLPGGVQVNPAKFPQTFGVIRQVNSGVLLGRRANAFFWEPVDNTLQTNLSTTTASDAASGTPVLNVTTTSGYLPGDIITVGSAQYTISAVNDLNSTLTLTANLSAAVPANTNVQLTTAINFDDFYLLACDIVDANRYPDAELYRHHKLVYINYLPGYPFSSQPNVLAKIKQIYETQMGM